VKGHSRDDAEPSGKEDGLARRENTHLPGLRHEVLGGRRERVMAGMYSARSRQFGFFLGRGIAFRTRGRAKLQDDGAPAAARRAI